MDNPGNEPSTVVGTDSEEVEENLEMENPTSKKTKPQYSYTKEELLKISKTPLANIPPPYLDEQYYNSYGVWEPERWFNGTRCATPHSEDGKGKRERSVDNDRELQTKRRPADTKEVVKEEQDGIVLGPQRRSFGTGCHVAHAAANRRPESPAEPRERDRDSSRRIGSGRIINREREREFGYRGGRDRFERDRSDSEKENRYNRNDRYARDRGDDRRPMRNDKNKGKRPMSVSEKAGSVETTESSSAENSQHSDMGVPPTGTELDLNEFFMKMDGIPGLVPNGTPSGASTEIGGSRFCQWFRNTSSPTPGFDDSRRSSFQEELLGPLRKDMDDPFPPFTSPSSNLFAPISPEQQPVAGEISGGGGNIMELLQQAVRRASIPPLAAETGSDLINNVRNVTMKELAMSGKAKSVQELEEGLKQIVLNKGRSNTCSPVVMNEPPRPANNDLTAFNKLLAQVSDGALIPAQMGAGFSNAQILEEKDILQEIVSRISPPPEPVKQDPLAGFLVENFKVPPPPLCSQQSEQLMNMLQTNSKQGQHSGWGNNQNQEPTRIGFWGSDGQELRASGWGTDPMQGLRPTAIGQPKTVSPNLSQPVIDHFHNIPQQQFRDKVLSQQNPQPIQPGLPGHLGHFPPNQQLMGPGFMQPQPPMISGFIPVAQPPNMGMMGRNGRISPHPASPAILDPMQQSLQTRIPSPLLFSQTPPMLSHAPSPIHPNQMQNVINPVTLQPATMIGRVPSPLELAVHVQNISQSAMVKKKLEEQRENARKRQEMRPRSPGFMGGNRTEPNVNDISHKPSLSSTMANLMPTSVMRKLQADRGDGAKTDIPHLSASSQAATKRNSGNTEKPLLPGSQIPAYGEHLASSAGATFPVRSSQAVGKGNLALGRPIVKGNQGGVDAKAYFQSQTQSSGTMKPVTFGAGSGPDVNGGPMVGGPEYMGMQTNSGFEIARALEQQRILQAVQRQYNLQMHPPSSMTPMGINPMLLRNMVHPAAMNQLGQMQQPSRGMSLDPRFTAAVAAQSRGMAPTMNLQAAMMGPHQPHPQHQPPTSRPQSMSLANLGIGAASAPTSSVSNSDAHFYQQQNFNMINKLGQGNVNNPLSHLGLGPKPNSTEQVSPNNTLAKFFGNEVLNQSLPNLPSVPMQALSLEEVERRQQIAAVHN